MRVAVFQYSAKTGHFLRAESGSSWLTYPYPPRTALLGLIGAILGLPKDTPQEVLSGAQFAVSGQTPSTHWHKAQLRQEVYTVGKKFSHTKEPDAKLQHQEWLWRPLYTIYVSLPDTHQSELERRLEKGAFHFSPCMGMSEMFAKIRYNGAFEAESLPKESWEICSIAPRRAGELDITKSLERQLALSYIQMPRDVTVQRSFSLEHYVYERDGKPLPINTDNAWSVDGHPILFL